MNELERREVFDLLKRIVGDRPLPPELQSTALQILGRLAMSIAAPPTSPVDDAARPSAFGAASGLGAGATAVANRRLVYVHGICRHDAGFSDDWWSALRPFTSAYDVGRRGDTRLEVLWSDLVNETATAFAAGAAISGPIATFDVGPDARTQTAAAIRETLRDRADQQQLAVALHDAGLGGSVGAGAPPTVAAAPSVDMVTGGGGAGFLGGSCIDDFSIYLVHEPLRQAVINRFVDVVRPQLAAGRELDIVSHSWGTVVAYEGLRQLEDAGFAAPQIHNWFTVGAALSIGAVKLRLRPANKDGRKPASVRRWVNLDAAGDLVGGPLRGRPYAVDEEYLNLSPVGCGSFFSLVSPSCAHSSYFQAANFAVNRDIFARFIDAP